MNRIIISFLLVFSITAVAKASEASELDNLIQYGLQHSASGAAIRASYDSEQTTRRAGYYSLIPSLYLSADYDISSPSSGDSSMQYSLSFSKSFGDIDSTIRALRTAEINAMISRYQADLECRNYIDSVIQAYAGLCILVKEKQINLASIEAKKVLLISMTIKLQHGREILLNVLKLSNEIESAKLNLRLNEISYSNELRLLKTLCAYTNAELKLQLDLPEMSGELPVDAYDLQLKVAYLQLTNLRITLNGVRRSQFLPTLSLSFSESYDIDENQSSFDAGIGLSYSVLDIFDRRNSIREYEGSILSQIESISNTIRIFENARSSFDTKLQAAYDDVAIKEQQLEIEKGLDELYRYQYETDQMDYYDYRVQQNNLLSIELDLLRSRSDLYILITRKNYGIATD